MVILGDVGGGIGVMTASPSRESPLLPLGSAGIFRSLAYLRVYGGSLTIGF